MSRTVKVHVVTNGMVTSQKETVLNDQNNVVGSSGMTITKPIPMKELYKNADDIVFTDTTDDDGHQIVQVIREGDQHPQPPSESRRLTLDIYSDLDDNALCEAVVNAVYYYIEEGYVRKPDGSKAKIQCKVHGVIGQGEAFFPFTTRNTNNGENGDTRKNKSNH